MRILMLHQETPDPNKAEFGAGGAEVIVRDIIDELRARDHDVTWITRRDQVPLLEGHWDVAHAVTIPHYIGMDVAESLMDRGVPVVFTLMDYWPFCGPRMCMAHGTSCAAVAGTCDMSCGCQPAPADWLGILNRAHVVAMNEHSWAICARNGIKVASVVEPGIDPDVWKPRGDRDIDVLTSAGYAPTPDAVSRMMPWKGFDVLQRACNGASFGVSACTGIPRVDMPKVLSRAKVYVFPSLYEETFGMALCEARASGCVCIASDVAGARAQITNGVDGILVLPGDAAALRSAIERVLSDYDSYSHMGMMARERVIGHNTIGHMIDGYEMAYATALGR